MKVTLIDAYLISNKRNVTLSHSPSMAIAYISSYLSGKGIEIKVIDAIGEGINNIEKYKDNYFRWGLTTEEIVDRIGPDTDIVGISALHSCQHNIFIEIMRAVKKKYPKMILVTGGVHATLCYKLMLDEGFDYVILGEGEESFYALCRAIEKKDFNSISAIDGIAYKNKDILKVNPKTKFCDIDSLPFPGWDLFPLENYYREKVCHSPVNGRYLPIITSRGCPHHCSFCSVHLFWQRKWRGRNAKSVVDEIEQHVKNEDIRIYHIMDDNMTVDGERAKVIFKDIIKRKLNIQWYGSAGLRCDNIDKEMLLLMKQSGCQLIAFAPESGSQRVLKEIYRKELDLNHFKFIAKEANKLGIKTCAYFVIGAKSETKEERKMTKDYILELVKLGLDEIGVFVLLSNPNTEIAKEQYGNKMNVESWEDLVHGVISKSLTEYNLLKKYKRGIYISFLLTQMIYHPAKILRLIKNIITGKQETKTDRALSLMIRKVFFRLYIRNLFKFSKK